MANLQGTRKAAAGIALFGLTFVLAGINIMLQAAEVVPHGRMNAPPWIGALVGSIILVPGLGILIFGLKSLISGWPKDEPSPLLTTGIVTFILTAFALALGGVALYGKARGFSGGLTLLGIRVKGLGSVTEGRVVFGLAAVFMGALAIIFGILFIGVLLAMVRGRQRGP